MAEAHGAERLEANPDPARLPQRRDRDGARRPRLFLFIGAVPHSELVAGVVERNEAGFILTGQDLLRGGKKPQGWKLHRDPFPLETSVPGIFRGRRRAPKRRPPRRLRRRRRRDCGQFGASVFEDGVDKKTRKGRKEGKQGKLPYAPHFPFLLSLFSSSPSAHVRLPTQSPLFADLPEADLNRLCEMVEQVQLPAGQELFAEGSRGDRAYVIELGELEVIKDSGGRPVLLDLRRPAT